MENHIILSICIPTYNRAEYLEKTILSIVNQKRFLETTEVEIVISDNCSEDNTKEISEKFIAIYGEKIQYHRNSINIKDANFEKVLSHGKGLFLKLNNDTLMHNDDTLDKIIELITINSITKDILFFSNGALKNIIRCHCNDLNEFIKCVSFNSTWIICFGIWKEDFDSINEFSRNAKLQLVQTDILLELISSNRSVIVDNNPIFISISPVFKGGYNIFQVFVTNYIGLLEEYRNKKQISWITLFNEKSKLMMKFIIPWTYNLWTDKSKYTFIYKNAFSVLLKKYCFHPIFYIGFVFLFCKLIKYYFLKLIKLIKPN